MTIKLGTLLEDKYYLSWMTQRIANFAPEGTHARKAAGSVVKQVANPPSLIMQNIEQQLIEERDNVFLNSANPFLLNALYRINISPSLSFGYNEEADGNVVYSPPRVFVTINNVEYEITQAKNNTIETLAYDVLPSRIEDGEDSHSYQPMVSEVLASNFFETDINDVVVEGPLYITISNNTSWEIRARDNIYFSKVFVKGRTRKGTVVTEAVPLRYNSTFKTINHWHSIESIYFNYISDSTLISIDTLPWLSNGVLDVRNLNIDPNGEEKYRFLNIAEYGYGHAFVSESYTTNDFNLVRMGLEAKDVEHIIELLDEDSNNLTFNAFTMKPYSDKLLAVANNKLYVYDTKLLYPDVTKLAGESPDVKMDIYGDRWIFARDEVATVKTRLLDFKNVPSRFMWSIQTPSSQVYNVKEDGSFWPTTTNTWVDNPSLDTQGWMEKQLEVTLTERGTYILTLDCFYIDNATAMTNTLSTKYLLYVPSATPEVTLDMPNTITNITNLCFDANGILWAENNTGIHKLNLYYDYFIADYENNLVWLKENYVSVRVEV
jgi:hypothetical protein